MSESDERQPLTLGRAIWYRSLVTEDVAGSDEDTENVMAPHSYDIDSSSINVGCGMIHSVNFAPHEDSDSDGSTGPLGDRCNIFDGNSGQSNMSESAYAVDEMSQFTGLEPSSILKAVVFLEDAYYYRSINHKVHPDDLKIYRQYQSTPVYAYRYFIICLLHMLAFFEYPSSLTITSDLRYQGERIQAPCWLTQCVELLCLLSLLLDNIIKMYLLGLHYFLKHKWDMLSVVILVVSLFDWSVSFGLGCHEFVRFRRILRPFFILQHSSLMKKIVNCLRRTVPEVASVLLLLFLHLFIFTLFGMLIFPSSEVESKHNSSMGPSEGGQGHMSNMTPSHNTSENSGYFTNFLDSLISLLVLLTTANNPDVTMPAYSKNRLASLFFILYLLIGLYCFMNMLLAVIYNQFRGYFLNSMQRDLLRRRLGVRASFEILRRKQRVLRDGTLTPHCYVGVGVGGHVIKAVVDKSLLPKHVKDAISQGLQGCMNRMLSVRQYQHLFYCLDKDVVHEQLPAIPWCVHPKWKRVQKILTHRYFMYFGIFMSFINLIIIAVSLGYKYDSSFRENHAFLQTANFSFIIYYLVEQLLKLWAFGWRLYVRDKGNLFDAVVTFALITGEIYLACRYGFPYAPGIISQENHSHTVWNIIRVVNIFIMVRMMKIIPHIKAMSLVVTVLIDLMKNMKAFAGVLVVIFYAFAIMGMELFHGAIEYKPEFVNRTFECGTYEQLNYWANNFDDFFASIIVLWDVMVVNNWHVFLYVFKNKTSPWSYLFFVVWWLMSVIIIMNLFTALIMENFIMKWDRRHQNPLTQPSTLSEDLTVSVYLNNDVRAMFRDLLQEPGDNELLLLLGEHHYLLLDR